jgi:hypothetical protein
VRTDVVSERSFGQDSPVHAYWLAHSEQFSVRSGRRTGTIEHVELDESLRPRSLAVRFAFRRTVVSAEEVQAVVPARRLIVVEPRPKSRQSPAFLTSARPASRRAADAGRTAVAAAGRAAVTAIGWLAVAIALVVQHVHARSRAIAFALAQNAERSRLERRARRADPARRPDRRIQAP